MPLPRDNKIIEMNNKNTLQESIEDYLWLKDQGFKYFDQLTKQLKRMLQTLNRYDIVLNKLIDTIEHTDQFFTTESQKLKDKVQHYEKQYKDTLMITECTQLQLNMYQTIQDIINSLFIQYTKDHSKLQSLCKLNLSRQSIDEVNQNIKQQQQQQQQPSKPYTTSLISILLQYQLLTPSFYIHPREPVQQQQD
eukprot:UN10134